MPEGAWFKVSDKTKGPPAKISFLLKAAYSCIFLSQVAMFSAYVGRLFSVYIIVNKTWWPIESSWKHSHASGLRTHLSFKFVPLTALNLTQFC